MTSDNQPLVSIYMPTKNRLALLKKAIQSVVEQTYSNIELIIVDDGSTDNTFNYLSDLSTRMDNLQIFRHDNSIGACAARNLAIKNAHGKFITGLDDDDLFLPDRVESLLTAYDEKYAFVCSSMWWDYGAKKRLIDKTEVAINLNAQLSYNEATTQILVERERVIELEGFDESFVACQDYDLWTRLIERYGSAFRIANPTYVVNDTGSSERMIANPNSVKGYLQYLNKFQLLMSKSNRANQEFMRLRRELKPMSISLLLRVIGTGQSIDKIRYFLASNSSCIRQLHRKYYKNK